MRTLILSLAVFLAAPPTPSLVPAQALDTLDDPEAYAVYGTILTLYVDSGGKALSVVLIDHSEGRAVCLGQNVVRRQFDTNIDALITSFRDANAHHYRLLPALFKPGLIYTPVSDAYAGGPRPHDIKLLLLSAVGFDRTKTWALVSVVEEPGMSEEGNMLLLHKDDAGHWTHAKESPICGWIS